MQENLHAKERRKQAPIAIHHYHCDHLGTPLALTDQAGHVVWAARLDPWGQVQEEYNPQGIHQEIRLPGQHHDRETGLYYNRHRYYDPEIGAYINQDPIGLDGGVNRYAYPINPQTEYDPLGLQKVSKTTQRTGTRQAAIFDSKIPDKELNKATANSVKTDKEQAKFWDDLKDFINPSNQTKARSNEALMCLEQKNTSTGQFVNHEEYFKGEPSLIPLGKPFPPSPDNLDPGWICTKGAFRPKFNGGPPPGL